MNNFTYRRAKITDLVRIIELLLEDELGQIREVRSSKIDEKYVNAFHKIDCDANQYLMVVENEFEIIGTCHLIFIPSLTFIGSTIMQIEAVRIAAKYRGQEIGSWMINQAINYAYQNGASIVQLTTNKNRLRAKDFYEKLGFETTHEGIKLYLNKNYN